MYLPTLSSDARLSFDVVFREPYMVMEQQTSFPTKTLGINPHTNMTFMPPFDNRWHPPSAGEQLLPSQSVPQSSISHSTSGELPQVPQLDQQQYTQYNHKLSHPIMDSHNTPPSTPYYRVAHNTPRPLLPAPPRSRLACGQCHLEKRGCDRIQPTCGDCSRENQHCIYNNANRSSPPRNLHHELNKPEAQRQYAVSQSNHIQGAPRSIPSVPDRQFGPSFSNTEDRTESHYRSSYAGPSFTSPGDGTPSHYRFPYTGPSFPNTMDGGPSHYISPYTVKRHPAAGGSQKIFSEEPAFDIARAEFEAASAKQRRRSRQGSDARTVPQEAGNRDVSDAEDSK
jgi:hypothetical protein